ncbi:MAG: uncharacterized protein JWN97_2960 [Nocardioides sp.]|nr:uncharacterized protein [Nocardioides sp.]
MITRTRRDLPEGPVDFERQSRVASLFYEAIAGRTVGFHLLDDVSGETPIPPDTDDTVRLPGVVDFFDNGHDNWGWYLVALAHRAFTYAPGIGTLGEVGNGLSGKDLVNDFVSRCLHPATGEAALGVLEGTRLDGVLRRRHPGLREHHARAQRHALDRLGIERVSDRGPRNQLLTILAAKSLAHEPVDVLLAPSVAQALPRCEDLVDWMTSEVTVAESVLAAVCLYRWLSDTPPMTTQDPVAFTLHPAQPAPRPAAAADAEAMLAGLGGAQRSKLEEEDRYALDVPLVLYRGVLGSRYLGHRDTGRLENPAMFAWREGLEGHAHHDHDHGHGHGHDDGDHEERGGPPEPIPHEHGAVHRWDVPWLAPVSIGSSNVFFYPEWDSVRSTYRPSWCRVVEEPLAAAGGPSPYGRAVLAAHRSTVTALQREWSRLPTEGMSLQRALADGDEIDLSAAVDTLVGLRAGSGFNGNVYTRKTPLGRDVVCGVLIDVSMSTADHVDTRSEGGFTIDETAQHLYGTPYRTVLDHERETAMVLAEIMERVSDQSMVYAFSSSGRHSVRMQRVKSVHEGVGTAVSRRIESLRPLDATRMGAAVRHMTAQLRRTEARSKMLMVISDGLPYDEDYGDDYGDGKDLYALQDTVRAFDEAESMGVRSVLFLTGDLDLGRLDVLGDRAVSVPHPGDLVPAVMNRYLRTRSSALNLARI